ncbi:hypothetical protein MAPG_02360 [Magnaporthiopsis poae ATCC 64411]|uniref:Uncharacterized protein n=1 Tax=Magnaporthiopsis poae (strain ATCC 64411 / 73-15) TaxID=644358 RepID=A0A0C4DR57_MAGP6|nr:hypothetical protein MAPG_02360 [Magnaporthiopsis poae ATCC 64411]
MVAIPNVMSDVLAMIEPRTPMPKGGGRGGSSRGSSSSSSSSGSSKPSSGSSSSSSSGSSSSSATSSSSSTTNNKAPSTSTSTSTSSSSSNTKGIGSTSSTTRPGAFIFVSSGHGGAGFYTGNGGFLPLWAFILIIWLGWFTLLFVIAFCVYWSKERKSGGKTRWGRVLWGAIKVATGLWFPIAIYRCCCGRNRKKGSGGTSPS